MFASMKHIFILIGLIICLNSYGQSVFKPASATKEGYSTEAELVAHSKFYNKFFSSDLTWIRVENTLSSKWTSAYCDCEFCRDSATSTATFYLKIGDSCETSAHFYPVSNKGTGVMKIKVFATNNTLDFVIGEYRITGWGASVAFLENEKFNVSPNPANSVLNIGFGSGEPYILSILSNDGKLIVSERVESLTNAMDISNYKQGIYIVRVESAGKMYYSKFVKI
jgi:hypothetical protein